MGLSFSSSVSHNFILNIFLILQDVWIS